jgi:hypothetical protein
MMVISWREKAVNDYFMTMKIHNHEIVAWRSFVHRLWLLTITVENAAAAVGWLWGWLLGWLLVAAGVCCGGYRDGGVFPCSISLL